MRTRRRRPRGPRPDPGAPQGQNFTAPSDGAEPTSYSSYGPDSMGSAGPPMDASPDAGLTNGGVRPGPDGPRPAPEGPRQAPGPDGMRRMDGNGNNRRRRRRGRSARPVSNSAPGAYQGAPPNAPRQAPQPPQMSGGPRGRRRRTRPGAERRRGGLEVLREMQQAGVALDPTERLKLELPAGEGNPPYGDRATGRAIDLIAPIGRGQRCLIVAPPKTGKTRILQCIAASVAYNHPEVGIYALLVDERPEEVTDFKRNTPANVIAASSDMSIEDHIATAEYAMEVVAAQVIEGKDVVLLLDSITRLARAYNANTDGGGRTMSGGLDSNAMQAPRQIFGAARKIEDGGSLTIIGTALVDTGSRMDQIIFEEFKGTGNSEIFLSRELAERRIFPAIDIARSGTRKEEKLFPPDQLNLHQMLRRVLLQMPLQEAITKLADRLNKTKTNEEFFQLLRNNE